MHGQPHPRTYVVYRRIKRPEMCCAVLEGSEFPPVIDPSEWAPAELLRAGGERPSGFDDNVAIFSCSVQGFYLFRWSGRRSMRWRISEDGEAVA